MDAKYEPEFIISMKMQCVEVVKVLKAYDV